MSEEQRNQPREENGDAARRSTEEAAEGRHAESDLTAASGAEAGSGSGSGSEAVGAGSHDAGVTGATGTSAELGDRAIIEGSSRYSDDPGDVPPTGSEESWSARPHPGYVADPRSPSSGKRIAAATLIGCLVLAFGVFAGVRLLASRSSNGNGAAPWTGAVKREGAVIGGINAQNAGAAPGVALPAGIPYGGSTPSSAEVDKAKATCQAATGNSSQLTATTGTASSSGDWAAKATAAMNTFRAESAKLGAAIATKDQAKVAAAATDMCSTFTTVAALPGNPDPAGAKTWATAVILYAEAASNAVLGVTGDPNALPIAAADLKQADAQLDALAASIVAKA